MGKSVLLLQALELLRTREGITAAELAAELGRSERTVYRYLAELSYELQAPVYCEGGVYRLAVRQDSSGFMGLNNDEALAVHVALTSTAMSNSSPFSSVAQSALRKIESTIRNHSFEELRKSQNKHVVAPSVFAGHSIDLAATGRLVNALTEDNRVRVSYRSRRSAKTENLLLDPYGLAFRRHNWYLVAYSHDHEKVVQLKLVRIEEIETIDERFERPPDFSLDKFYEKSWEVWAGGEDTEVKVRFSPQVASLIREGSYHPSQQLEDTPDGGVVMTVTVSGTEEISFWILGYGAEAEVLQPASLREHMRSVAVGMVARYNGSPLARGAALADADSSPRTAPLADIPPTCC